MKIICGECGQYYPDDKLSNISQKVRALRSSRELGVRGFAGLVGLSPATISRVENSGKIDLESALKICESLKLSMDWLVGKK